MTTKTTLNKLAAEIYTTNVEHGFWPTEAEGERNFGEAIALAMSELAEALEDHRNGAAAHGVDIKVASGTWINMTRAEQDALARIEKDSITNPDDPVDPTDIALLVGAGVAKPVGTATELVDVLIRTLDMLAGFFPDVDIDHLVREKMAYNRTRAPKHGKAY